MHNVVTYGMLLPCSNAYSLRLRQHTYLLVTEAAPAAAAAAAA
jgi:hypothetical protein